MRKYLRGGDILLRVYGINLLFLSVSLFSKKVFLIKENKEGFLFRVVVL